MTPDLIRIEYKLDLIMRALQHNGLMLAELPDLSGITEDTCAVCNQVIKLRLDPLAEELERICGCSLPVQIVRGISTVATPEVLDARNQQREIGEVSPNSAEGGDRDR
jgi:hypothetical protein